MDFEVRSENLVGQIRISCLKNFHWIAAGKCFVFFCHGRLSCFGHFAFTAFQL